MTARTSRQRVPTLATVPLLLFTGCAVLPEPVAPPVEAEKPIPAEPEFVRVREIDGKHWFVRGDEKFLCLAINAIIDKARTFGPAPPGHVPAYDGITKYQGNYADWATAVERRLRTWGFNTLGAWSHEYLYGSLPLYHTRVVWLGHWKVNDDPQDRRLVDVWSEEYQRDLDATAAKEIPPHHEDEYLIGYFVNNELPWYGERGWPTTRESSLVSRYFELPAGAPGKARLILFLKDWYEGNFEAFSEDWLTEATGFDQLPDARAIRPNAPSHLRVVVDWAGVVAEQYFRLCDEALRKYDSNHLNLGVRFAGRTYIPVMKACAKYADVVSMNYYRQSGVYEEELMGAIAAACAKPLMITEFSWRGMENSSGCSNSRGAPVTVQTQQDRADAFRRYAEVALAQPYLLGYHWFCYADQPPGGRFDGEDCNYGLVDTQDRPYATLLEAIADVNHRAVVIHGSSTVAKPAENPELLADYREVGVRGEGQGLQAPVVFQAAQNLGPLWGDAQAGDGITVVSTNATAVLNVKADSGWGCGIAFALPTRDGDRDNSSNLLGARRLVIRLRAPEGLRFNMGLAESGCGPPGEQTYDGYGHADGESYRHHVIEARAGWHEYTFPLRHMQVNSAHGNQRGNLTIDMDAVWDVDLYVPGRQDPCTVELDWVRIE